MTIGFWMNETGVELRPAIVSYLEHRPLTRRQVYLVRLYLAHWIDGDDWAPTPGLDGLPKSVAEIETTEDIRCWLLAAEHEGIDPL